MSSSKKKADKYCSMGIISLLIGMVFIVILAASTAKMDMEMQTIGGILAALFIVAAIVLIIVSIRIYDGEED